MKTFFEPVQGMAGIEEIKKSFSRLGHAVMVSGCIDTQKAHLLEALGEQYPIRVVITSDEVKARQLREDCLFFDKSSIYYPAKDFIFYSADVHGNQLAGERLACIYKIIQVQKHISEDSISNGKTDGIQPENKNAAGLTVVTTIDGCADLLVPLEKYKNATISFEKGQVLDLEALSKELVQIGYERCAIVDGQGKFAVRGGIIDIFPYTEETPVRIELWDDEVDSIRLFDVESQRSIEKIERFEAFPATECLLSEEEIARGREKLQEELAIQLTAFGNDKKKKTAEDIEKCNRIRRNVADMERTGDYSKALRMFAEELTGFLSYFPKEGTLFVLDEPNRLNERMELILYEYTESMKNRLEGGYILPGQTDMIHGIESIYAGLEKKRTLLLSALDYKPEKFAVAEYVRIDTRSISPYHNSFEYLADDLKKYKRSGYKSILVCNSRTRAARIVQDLADLGLTAYFSEDFENEMLEGTIMVTYGSLHKGFEYPLLQFVVIAENDIFASRHKKREKKKKYDGK